MQRIIQRGAALVSAVVLATLLAACGTAAAPSPTVAPTGQPAQAVALPTSAPAVAASPSRTINSTGDVRAARSVELAFLAGGQVAEIMVEEGARVEQGQVLALLDTRPFDAQVQQAEAALAGALAQQAASTDTPRAADARAAAAQVQQAEVNLAQARAGQTHDIRVAAAALEAAQVQEQEARNRLSRQKTQAEAAVHTAAQSLTQAQAAYAKASSDWNYVKDTGNDPQQPEVVDAEGEPRDNKLEDAQREGYYAAFVQAEAALRQAEQAVTQAAIDAEEARKAEVTGVRAAELHVVQAQAAFDRLRVPEGESEVALAQSGVALARAQRAQLDPAPSAGQRDQLAAGVAQAEAALAQARLNREYATLRAPFAGTVAARDLQLGQIVAAGTPVVRLVDDRALRFEAAVADFDVARLREGQRATVRLDALPDVAIEGVVRYIAPAADEAGTARTYLVRVELPATRGIRVGMSGRLVIGDE
jgi:HlyD family secretion protein